VSTSHPTRRAVVTGLTALGAATLAGCARIPSRSAVMAGPDVAAGGPGSPYLAPNPPAPGADPEEVVRGFLLAGLGSENDWSVARQYLTPALARAWDPRAQTTVLDAAQDIVVSGDEAAVSATLSAVLVVDAVGTARAERPATSRSLEFVLAEVDGELRIAEAPDGIVVSSSAFDLLYRPSTVYFLSGDDAFLVPEERWFLAARHFLEVVLALGHGPSAALRGAATTYVPAPAGDTDDLVAVDEAGRAVVQLPAPFYSEPYRSRQLAAEQIRASLTSAGALSDVIVRSGDIALADDPAADTGRPQRPLPGSEPYAAATTGGVVGIGGPGDEASLVPALAQTRVVAPRLAAGASWAVALSEDRTTLLVATTDDSVPLRPAATGTALVGPVLDRFDLAWTAPESGDGALLAVPCAAGGAHLTVSAPWLEGRILDALALAPDGVRLLVASSGPEGVRVDLAAVHRDDAGRPTELVLGGSPLLRAGALTSLGWSAETAAVVVVTRPVTNPRDEIVVGDAPMVLAVSLDSSLTALPETPAPAVRAASSSVADQSYVTTADAVLYVRSGDDWSLAGADRTDPGFR
jgi:hypothetical protein